MGGRARWSVARVTQLAALSREPSRSWDALLTCLVLQLWRLERPAAGRALPWAGRWALFHRAKGPQPEGLLPEWARPLLLHSVSLGESRGQPRSWARGCSPSRWRAEHAEAASLGLVAAAHAWTPEPFLAPRRCSTDIFRMIWTQFTSIHFISRPYREHRPGTKQSLAVGRPSSLIARGVTVCGAPSSHGYRPTECTRPE